MKLLVVFLFISFFSFFLFAQKNDSLKSQSIKSEQKLKVEIATTTVKQEVKKENVKQISNDKKDEKTAAEDEYSEVLVDNMESNSYQDTISVEMKEGNIDSDKIPLSYGLLRGVFNDGQKNIMVFEDETGVITFIQIYFEKGKLKWKFLNQIERN